MASVEFSISDICYFTNTTPMSKNFVDGVQLVREELIVCVEETIESPNNDNSFEIHACCMENSESDDAPYKVQIQVDHNGKLCRAECSCQTGDIVSCKHIIGLLLYYNRHSMEDLELICYPTRLEHEFLPMEKSKTKDGSFNNVEILDNVDFALRMRKIEMGYLPDRGFEKNMYGILDPVRDM